MLIELWQQEITKLGNELFWIMQSSIKSSKAKRITEKDNNFYILQNLGNRNNHFIKLIDRYLNIILKLILSSYLIIKYRIKIVHVHDGAEEGIIGLILKKMLKAKYIYTYTSHFVIGDDFNQDNRSIELNLRKIYFRLLKKLYLKNLIQSDLLLPISENLRIELNKTFKIPLNKMMVVSESASTYFLSSSKGGCNLHKYNMLNANYMNLIYVGSLGKKRKIEFIIDAFEIVTKEFQGVNLFILGWGETKQDIPELNKYILEKNLDSKIFFINRVSYYEIPEIVSQFDIGLSAIPPFGFYVFATPTKCIDYLSLKVPVVANKEIYDQKKLIEASNGGILTSYNELEYANGVLSLLKDENLRKKCAIKGYKWIKNNRTYKLVANKIDLQLRDLV